MRFCPTPQQAADLQAAIAAAVAAHLRGEPWDFQFELPDSAVDRRTQGLEVVSPPFVRFAGIETRLPGKQFQLLKLVVERGGTVSFTECEEVVWFGVEVRDDTVSRMVRPVSAHLANAGFPFSLSVSDGMIVLEKL